MAGRCSSRFVDPPNAACTTIALRTAWSVTISRVAMPRAPRRTIARAERRAMSSQIGCPEGASALCGSESPSASPTTCEVAAVPRNWQPPPGDPHARQPSSAALVERDLAVGEARADRLHLARVLAVRRRQRHAAGHEHARQVAQRRQRQHHRGQPLVAGRHAEHALARRQRADQPPQHDRRVVAVRRGCPSSRSSPACGRRRDRSRSRRTAGTPRPSSSAAAACISRPISQWPV